MRRWLLLALLLPGLGCLWAQDVVYTTATIPEELKENANAVIRDLRVKVEVESRKVYKTTTYRVVSVLNEKGLQHVDAVAYDDVVNISATLLDAHGKIVQKLKRKDFKDVAAGGYAIISDNRMVYADITPISYPCTIIFESEVRSKNTAFLPSLFPLDNFYVSCEKQTFEIKAPKELGLKYKEYNFENKVYLREEIPNGYKYSFADLKAYKHEPYAPSFADYAPYVLFGLERFNLEGVDGDATSWENFSSWMYNNILTGTTELSPETIKKAQELTQGVSDPVQKAKILYQYMQSKTRYVAIMLGIGGWKPMLAKDVDRLGYGDCKALSNYLRALLDAVGVSSDYAVIYGGERRDLKEDFVSMQGNHVVLSIPTDQGRVWMECTSQTDPFGYQGNFTGNRTALLIKPNGGGMVRTEVYNDNLMYTQGEYAVDAAGNLNGKLQLTSTGLIYGNRDRITQVKPDDRIAHYKEEIALPNLKIKNSSFKNDKDKVSIIENLQLSSERFAESNSGRLIFAVNAFNKYGSVPPRTRNRTSPFEVSNPLQMVDEYRITLPEGYSLETRSEAVSLKDKFGEYSAEIIQENSNTLIYKRRLNIKSGRFQKEEYDAFRKFLEGVSRADNSKVVLIKSN